MTIGAMDQWHIYPCERFGTVRVSNAKCTLSSGMSIQFDPIIMVLASLSLLVAARIEVMTE